MSCVSRLEWNFKSSFLYRFSRLNFFLSVCLSSWLYFHQVCSQFYNALRSIFVNIFWRNLNSVVIDFRAICHIWTIGVKDHLAVIDGGQLLCISLNCIFSHKYCRMFLTFDRNIPYVKLWSFRVVQRFFSKVIRRQNIGLSLMWYCFALVCATVTKHGIFNLIFNGFQLVKKIR